MTIDSPKGPEREARPEESLLKRLRSAMWHAWQNPSESPADYGQEWAAAAFAVVAPELERLTAEVALHRERDALTRKALQTDGDGPLQFAALIVRQQRDKALAEVSRLREQLATQPKADVVERAALWLFRAKTSSLMSDVLQRASMTWHRVLDQQARDAWISYAREMLADLGWPAPVSESVPATPRYKVDDRIEWNPIWDDWVSGVVTKIWPDSERLVNIRLDENGQQLTVARECLRHADPLRASAPSEASPNLQIANEINTSASSPPSGGDSDTTPRVWAVDDPHEPPDWVIALAQPPGSYWKYLIRGTKSGWYFSNSLTPAVTIAEGSGWGWAFSRAELPLTQVTRVRDVHGDVWTWVPGTHEWSSPETQNCAWSYMRRKWSPLTEVAPSLPQEGGTDG